MTASEILMALTIHFFIPLSGLVYFIVIAKKMKRENIPKTTIYELFIIFFTYGGLLLVILTAMFWKWSGLSSLGIFYLIFVAPIVMGIISYKNKQKKGKSFYYNRIYKAGLLYFVIAPATFLIFYLIFLLMYND